MYRYIYKWGLDDGEFNARGGGQRQSTGHMDEDARFIFIVFIFTHHNSAAMTKKRHKNRTRRFSRSSQGQSPGGVAKHSPVFVYQV